jgi:hypothetical protein
VTHVAMMVQADSVSVPACDCTFSTPRVRWYLYIWRQARIAREPFADVMRSEARESRSIDPWIRGARGDANRSRLIGLSLEEARDRGNLELAPWNAEKIANFLCECEPLTT